MQDWWSQFTQEILHHKTHYAGVGLLLALGIFVRVYRVNIFLEFFYDQGRDAMTIRDFLYFGEPFLLGPVTGLAGIFLGPLYYYLITPFYFLGGGNPVWPAVFVNLLGAGALPMVYYLGWKFHSRAVGVIALVISSFSYYMVIAGRWFSNPTPILLTSVLLLFALWQLLQDKSKNWWIAVVLLVGMSLQFESASAFYYLPIVGIFFLWRYFDKRKSANSFPDIKTFVIAVCVFLLTLLPQIVFNFRHDNLLLNNFLHLFRDGESFSLKINEVFWERLTYFQSVYYSKIFPGNYPVQVLFAQLSALGILIGLKSLWKKKVLPLLFLFLLTPMVGYILFQGNFGNIYDYYMTGYYLPLILFFSLGLGVLWKYDSGKLLVASFIFLFAGTNYSLLANYFDPSAVRRTSITLKNQNDAVDWIFADARDLGITDFNVHVYVPPVIPYTYDYLLWYRGKTQCGESLCGFVQDKDTEYLYTLFEEDSTHQDRLDIWMVEQGAIGHPQLSQNYGGITVERRKRK